MVANREFKFITQKFDIPHRFSSEIWEIRGFAYLENLNFELAENDFKKSYEIDGNKANFKHNIGQIFYRKKDLNLQ